ncbi:1-phosphofructokinase family hexose kinase [Amycolatopsis sp. CA-230715]|uniref:1-phosphofructokinase family hexose kinase n=1 Tax=Amycolatopsis sp. CA-230715 TaxID=2745196 RepID=UPI001C0166CB|nr:1-phosphofructokinase family hexose kinase [Amycolatopsis sp. CA-230715]QWF78334.1 Tagatose-6-phosphate kinase [Amycolatopsis sp. CA-230715]
MIVTVTPNAALDVTYRVPRLVPDAAHRTSTVERRAGGKGVNVARVLHALGAPTRALGIAGGHDGAAVVRDLAAAGIAHEFTEVAAGTRRTTTILSTVDETVTLISEPGPALSEQDWARFVSSVGAAARTASVLVCSGSLPGGVPVSAYADLLRDAGMPTVLDTSGPALTAGLSAHPSVVKPNLDELRDVTGIGDPLRAAEELCRAGAGAVVASLGADGMLAVAEGGSWLARPSKALTGNTTGAGDAAVAGIALELAGGAPDWPAVLRRAVALSAAAVLGPLAGDIDIEHYRREYDAVEVDHATGTDD